MNPRVSILLRRLASLAATVSAVADTQATPQTAELSTSENQTDAVVSRQETSRTNKLVFGVAREGWVQLAAHRSHSSHSSHASHASHYSGASGGSYTPAPPPPPAPKVVPTPVAPKVQVQPETKASTKAATSELVPAQGKSTNPTTNAQSSAKAGEPIVPLMGVASDADIVMDAVLKKLPKIRSRWPKETHLTKDVQFNLLDGDRVMGVIGLKAGAKVKIVEIKPQHAVIQFADSQSPMPVANTDLIEQLGGAALILALPDDPLPETEKPAVKKPPTKPL